MLGSNPAEERLPSRARKDPPLQLQLQLRSWYGRAYSLDATATSADTSTPPVAPRGAHVPALLCTQRTTRSSDDASGEFYRLGENRGPTHAGTSPRATSGDNAAINACGTRVYHVTATIFRCDAINKKEEERENKHVGAGREREGGLYIKKVKRYPVILFTVEAIYPLRVMFLLYDGRKDKYIFVF
eukprot:GEMP01097183.1.p1 GENE.GEMP01097183.1~~GEMP01097183.1.p1  ORF type:complete len:186 (+),score=20.29 GEMP01097183.1:179-736(+)